MAKFRSPICIIFLTIVAVSLGACDKGKSSLKSTEEEFKSAVDTPITEANLSDAVKLTVLYGAISRAYADKDSGKMAAEKLEKMKERAVLRIEELSNEMGRINQVAEPSLTKYFSLASPLLQKVRKHKHSYRDPDPKNGDCVANVGVSEFDKLPDQLMNMKIYKIVKVGQDEFMVKNVHVAEKRNLAKVTEAIAEIGKEEPIKKLYLDSAPKVSCAEAEKMAAAYLEFLEKFKAIEPLNEQLSSLATIKNGGKLSL